jgi:hypothetical protein
MIASWFEIVSRAAVVVSLATAAALKWISILRPEFPSSPADPVLGVSEHVASAFAALIESFLAASIFFRRTRSFGFSALFCFCTMLGCYRVLFSNAYPSGKCSCLGMYAVLWPKSIGRIDMFLWSLIVFWLLSSLFHIHKSGSSLSLATAIPRDSRT